MKHSVTICSIHFKERTAYRPFRPMDGVGANHKFVLPAAAEGGFSTLVVNDMLETVRPMHNMQFEKPVFAPHIADCLVNEWSANSIGEGVGKPGIFVCAGDKPTNEELAAAHSSEVAWMTFIVNRAQKNWIDNKPDEIGTLERECAMQLGRLNYEWLKEPKQVKMVACKACGVDVPETAAMCPAGHIVNLEAAKAYRSLEAELKRELDAAEQKTGKPVEPEAQLAALAGTMPPPMKPNVPLRPQAR